MRYFVQITIFTAALLILLPLTSHACSCFYSGPPCQSFWNIAAVFSGEVKEITQVSYEEKVFGNRTFTLQRNKVQIKIKEAFRGVSGDTVAVTTGLGDGDCGYDFKVGESYLVYAYKNPETGELGTSICSRTQLLEKAAEDLTYFKSLATAPAGSLIYGSVMQFYPHKNDAPYRQSMPLVGIPVTAESVAGKNETVTNKEGAYRFEKMPAGDYQISLKTPENLLGADKPVKVKVYDKGCVDTGFSLQTKTLIGGRVFDSQSVPVSNMPIDLMPVDQLNNSRHFDNKLGWVKEDGSFKFDSIPDGQYYLGVRLSGLSDLLFPYPQTFYPGTTNLAEAKILTIKEGTVLEKMDFKLPPKLRIRKVQGMVVYPDGTPVANAQVVVNENQYFYSYSFRGAAAAKQDGTFSFDIIDGVKYSIFAYAATPPGYPSAPSRQYHARAVDLPQNGDVTNLRFIISEPGGN